MDDIGTEARSVRDRTGELRKAFGDPGEVQSEDEHRMDALVMCGGEGTRLDDPAEKPLFEVAGTPMVEPVITALSGSSVDETYAAVSPNAPGTRRFLAGRCELVETPGEGYVEDLSTALEALSSPVLTVAADLPLLEADVVDRVLNAAPPEGSLTVCTPLALKERLGVTVERERGGIVPTGLNIVRTGDADEVYTTYDARLAVNVNTRSDAAVAEALHPDTIGDGREGSAAIEGHGGSD